MAHHPSRLSPNDKLFGVVEPIEALFFVALRSHVEPAKNPTLLTAIDAANSVVLATSPPHP
jgi:hypothetical protein